MGMQCWGDGPGAAILQSFCASWSRRPRVRAGYVEASRLRFRARAGPGTTVMRRIGELIDPSTNWVCFDSVTPSRAARLAPVQGPTSWAAMASRANGDEGRIMLLRVAATGAGTDAADQVVAPAAATTGDGRRRLRSWRSARLVARRVSDPHERAHDDHPITPGRSPRQRLGRLVYTSHPTIVACRIGMHRAQMVNGTRCVPIEHRQRHDRRTPSAAPTEVAADAFEDAVRATGYASTTAMAESTLPGSRPTCSRRAQGDSTFQAPIHLMTRPAPARPSTFRMHHQQSPPRRRPVAILCARTSRSPKARHRRHSASGDIKSRRSLDYVPCTTATICAHIARPQRRGQGTTSSARSRTTGRRRDRHASPSRGAQDHRATHVRPRHLERLEPVESFIPASARTTTSTR